MSFGVARNTPRAPAFPSPPQLHRIPTSLSSCHAEPSHRRRSSSSHPPRRANPAPSASNRGERHPNPNLLYLPNSSRVYCSPGQVAHDTAHPHRRIIVLGPPRPPPTIYTPSPSHTEPPDLDPTPFPFPTPRELLIGAIPAALVTPRRRTPIPDHPRHKSTPGLSPPHHTKPQWRSPAAKAPPERRFGRSPASPRRALQAAPPQAGRLIPTPAADYQILI